MSIFKTGFRALLVALMSVLVAASVVQAAVPLMPVSEVKTGMKGIAKTVVEGTKIEIFDVEVMGVLKDKGPSGDLILVKTSGAVIDKSGGIAQGMSGSPVYIDGRLIGAVAYGWSFTDHRIGMVTPIHDMLKMLDYPDKANSWLSTKSDQLKPVTTPLMVSGLDTRSMNWLAKQLQPYNLTPVQSGGDATTTTEQPSTIEPGSAVSVQLMRGDISMGAIGTVTYRDGDNVLAFGHPFLKKGNVGFMMSGAYVYTTLSSMENSFKLGTALDMVGTVNQDRGAGVAGRMGAYPRIVPALIRVTDKDMDRTKSLAVMSIHDQELTPLLLTVASFRGIEKVADRVGSGTASVSIEITGEGLPGGVVRRQNMFYSAGDIGETAVGELLEGLHIIMNNKFKPVNVYDVKFNATVQSERKTASIMKVKAAKDVVKPGEEVEVAVKLHTYRGEDITRNVKLKVPETSNEGVFAILVRGGGYPSAQTILDKLMPNPQKPKAQNLDEQLKDYLERDCNNELVLELIDYEALAVEEEGPKTTTNKDTRKNRPSAKDKLTQTPAATKEKEGEAKVQDNKAKVSLDYIVEGFNQVLIQVTKGEQKEDNQPK